MTRLRFTPKGELEAKAIWTSTIKSSPLKKQRRNRAKVGYIGSRFLRETLAYELDIVPVLEGAHIELLKYSNIEFLLVESVYDTQPGDWRLQQLHDPEIQTELTKLVLWTKELGIPTVFWFTLDDAYCPLYRNFAEIFDRVYCCSPEAQTYFEQANIKTEVLLPTFEPALYNALQHFEQHSEQRFYLACDALSDILDDASLARTTLTDLSDTNLAIYDSTSDIWQSKLQIKQIDSDSLLGSVNSQDTAQILKQSKLYVSFTDSMKSKTARQWLKLQAMACRVPVIQIGELEPDDFLSTWTLCIEDPVNLSEEIDHFDNDWLYAERVAHQAWRFVMSEHRVEKRVDKLLKDLFDMPAPKKYKASLILPTIRKEFVQWAIEQYDMQTYSNRELVIVWNGPRECYSEVERLSRGRDDITCSYLPSEQSTGDCINHGIHAATGEYVFKFDDDDYYGKHYLEDMMLYFEIADFDIIGKPLAYYKFNEEPYLYKRALPSGFPLTTFSTANLSHSKISVSGSTLSGRRSVFVSNPYTRAYRAADSGWYKLANVKDLYGISADILNSIFWRRTDGRHTWDWNAGGNHRNEECFVIDDFMC